MNRRRGWIVPTLALALAALPLVVATVRTLSGGWMAIGDNGLILLRAEDVATAHHPLLGTWTSASQAAGRTISNPGPLWFDVLAPFVKVAGPSVGLAVAVMVANLAAIAGAAWAAQRVGGQRAMVLTTALSAGLAWSLGSELLFDAWQPHAMLLPFWCLLVMCWALAAGDLLMAPFVVAIASLLVQTHLSFVYVVAIIGAATVVMTSAGLVRMARAGGAVWDAERSWLRRIGLWTAGVAVLAWCQPLCDQFFGEGNLGGLLGSSGSGGDNERVGLSLGARFVASVVALPPWWTRPGFSSIIRATGVVDDPKGRTLAEGDVAGGTAALAGLLAVAVVLAVVIVAGRRWRSRPILTLGVLAAVAVVAALVSMVLHAHRGHRHQPAPDALAVADLRLRPPGRGGRGRRVVTAATRRRARRPGRATALLAVLNLPTYAAPEGPTADRPTPGRRWRSSTSSTTTGRTSPCSSTSPCCASPSPTAGRCSPRWAATASTSSSTTTGWCASSASAAGPRGTSACGSCSSRVRRPSSRPPGARTVAFVDGLDADEESELDRARGRGRRAGRRGRAGARPTQGGDAVRAGRIDLDDVVVPAAATPDRSRPAASWPPWSTTATSTSTPTSPRPSSATPSCGGARTARPSGCSSSRSATAVTAMRTRSAAARAALRRPSFVPRTSRHSLSGTSRNADAGSPLTPPSPGAADRAARRRTPSGS